MAIFGVFLLLVIIGGGILVATIFRGGTETVALKPGTHLVIELSGRITEHQAEPSFNIIAGDRSPVLSELLAALEHAKTDDKISAVILQPAGISGFADLRELRESLKEFKKSSKPVYAYLEIATDRDYYLASIADSIIMVPSRSGGMVMMGMGISRTYLARTFEKVGLKFSVLHAGKFKGTYENFSRDRMSDEVRLSLQTLIDGLFDTYVQETVETRPQVSRAALEGELLHGKHYLISGNEALEKGFVDLVMDRQALMERLGKGEELETVSVTKYLKSFAPSHRSQEIAIVYAEGGIEYDSDPTIPLGRDKSIEPESFIKELKQLREDESVKAVVLRVNSPGGSSLASELILQEVQRLKAVKPVVVSMGNVAASGGYYISCAANHVVAQPNTITGSIGVVGVIPTAEKLYEKVEARVETVEKGKWAQFFRFDKDLTEAQIAVLTELMQGIYDDFVSHVAAGRELSREDVEAAASGRIWSGQEALERQLVVELGGLNTAISKAAELANVTLDDVQIRSYPKEEDFLHFLLNKLGTAVHEIRQSMVFSLEEREIVRAAEYLKGFLERREFVQTLAPLDVEF